MTPKEKAENLIIQFWELDLESYEQKQCALIAIDEIIDILGGVGVYGYADAAVEQYWNEVKQEIEKL